jgi:hypothetical protein
VIKINKSKISILKLCWIFIIIVITIFICITIYKNFTKPKNKVTVTNKSSLNQRKIIGTVADIGSGTFTGGKDILDGSYDVTPIDGEGTFLVTGSLRSINSYLGNTKGMTTQKVRVKILNGDKIQVHNIKKVHFEPVKTPFVTSQKETILYTGRWFIGEDILKGKYKIISIDGDENLVIYDKTGLSKVTETIKMNTNNQVNLQDGDILNVFGVNKLKFIPIK